LVQIFKLHGILFALMDAVANLDELKLALKKELRQEILAEVLDIIRDEFYPPEEKIRNHKIIESLNITIKHINSVRLKFSISGGVRTIYFPLGE